MSARDSAEGKARALAARDVIMRLLPPSSWRKVNPVLRWPLFIATAGCVAALGFVFSASTETVKAASDDQNQTRAALINGDFESATAEGTPTAWALERLNLRRANWSLEAGREGKGLRITVAGATARVTQNLAHLPRGSFSLRGSYRTEGNLSPSQCQLIWLNADGGQLATNVIALDEGFGWSEFDRSLNVPAGAAGAQLAFDFGGRGAAWLDSLELEETSASPSSNQ